MSILNISTTPSLGMLSTDTAFWYTESPVPIIKVENIESFDFNACLKNDLTQKPNPIKLHSTSKIFVLPHFGAAAAGNGDINWGMYIKNTLCALECQDIADFELLCPKVFSNLSRDIVYLGGIIGWSDKLGKIMGFQFRPEDGFIAHRIKNPHGSQPPLSNDDPSYLTLWEAMQVRQPTQKELTQLHCQFAKNQYSAYQTGRYGTEFHCGGELNTASVTCDGILIQRHFPFVDLPDNPEINSETGSNSTVGK